MTKTDELRELFQGPYDRDGWRALLHQHLGATKFKAQPQRVQAPPTASEHGIEGWLLGDLDTPDGFKIGLFDFTVTDDQAKRSRVGLRALVVPYVQATWGQFDAALAAFHAPTETDASGDQPWRVSFICELKGQKTSPKRYTYVFGDPASRHRTAVDRFMKASASRQPGQPIEFKELKEAFAVETLTKEFYGELFDWYLWALSPEAGVKFPDVAPADADERPGLEEHLIRLITRLMFVWFIRQKKLVPEELFDKRALKDDWLEAFDPCSMTSGVYYNAILQNLFFATLNNEIGARAFADDEGFRGMKKDHGIKTLFRDRKDGTWFKRSHEDVLKLFREVPFLNGGLFECLDKADQDDATQRIVYRDGFSREEKHRAHIPNELFFGKDDVMREFTVAGARTKKKVSGLIEILGRYNFTIEENTPDDMDVALDPELLGKVFENLLGSFNPETRETARNASGSFYTPREIVGYMVDEALEAYMAPVAGKTKEEQRAHLLQIKVLDPACGSGAFPMGMLGAIVTKARELGDYRKLHELKLDIIQNCIFGVDIQTIAVQIAKLRFFISLVCEEDPRLTDVDGNYGVSPLPNLETRFVAADALVAKRRQEGQLSIEDPEIGALKRELDEVRHRHFGAKTRKEKLKLRTQDEAARGELVALLKGDAFSDEDARQIAEWDPYDQNAVAAFFDPVWMLGVDGGFDVVIGNPPYIQLQSDHGRLGDRYGPCGFETLYRTGDIYCLFYERGWQLLKPGGHVCYITSDKWMRNDYGQPLRKFFAEKTCPKILIDFAGEQMFESAIVNTNILLFEKAPTNGGETASCIGTADCRDDLRGFVRKTVSPCAFTSSEPWIILSPVEQDITRKVEAVGTPLKEWDIRIEYGIKTGCNEAFVIDEDRRAEILSRCADAAERARTEQLIRPALRGRDLKRYSANWAGLYLIATHNGCESMPRIDIDDYPAVKGYLDLHWEKISRRADRGATPYNLRNCAYMDDLSKPKIVWGELSDKAKFVMSDSYMLNTGFFMVGEKLSYILGLLNSKLIEWYFAFLGTKSGMGTVRWLKYTIERLPLVVPDQEQEIAIASRVDRILAAKRDDRSADTSDLDREIDDRVFDLYGLTEEERERVRGGRQ